MKDQIRAIMGIVLFFFVLFPMSSGLPAEIYKWKDRDGNLFFSDTPPPPGFNTEVKSFKDEPAVARPSKVSPSQSKVVVTKEKRPYSNIRVTMYMTPW